MVLVEAALKDVNETPEKLEVHDELSSSAKQHIFDEVSAGEKITVVFPPKNPIPHNS